MAVEVAKNAKLSRSPSSISTFILSSVFSFCSNKNHCTATMFRYLFRKRGKANISLPETPHKAVAVEMPLSQTLEVLKPLFRVAIFTGYTQENYRLQGMVGGFVWLIMLATHGTLDFLAARQVYTYGWASVSLSLVLLCLLCTIFSNRITLPWLEKGVSRLEDEQRYSKTLNRFAKIFKVR